MTYKIGIVGSREFQDEILVRAFVSYLPLYLRTLDFIVVSGKARGTDTWAANETLKLYGPEHLLELPAKWTKVNRFGKTYYDPGAGHERNEIIVRQCQELVIFWDGHSPGSTNDIELCEKYKLYHHIVRTVEDFEWM